MVFERTIFSDGMHKNSADRQSRTWETKANIQCPSMQVPLAHLTIKRISSHAQKTQVVDRVPYNVDCWGVFAFAGSSVFLFGMK